MVDSQEKDLRYLRENTLLAVYFVTVVLILGVFYIAILIYNFNDPRLQFSPYWLGANTFLLLITWLSYRLHRRDRINLAAHTFILGCIVAVNITLLETGAVRSFFPYLFLLAIALSGLLISPSASLWTALVCILSGFIVLFVWFGPELRWMLRFTPPAVFAVLIALITWGSADNLTTALGWAVDSQRRAQIRRDQLFESQQEIQRANHQLEAVNARLAIAQKAAEEANEIKTKFITNLSHELRTPLNAIITFSYILAQKNNGPSNTTTNGQQQDYLQRIQEAGNHLLSIVNDLLDLAKIEAGQMDLVIEPVDLAPAIRRAAQLTEGLLNDKPVTLGVHLDDEPLKVMADPSRLQQVLFNLLSNAAKYTYEGQITICARTQAEDAVVSITDTGIGIQESELDDIFKEFHQTEAARLHQRRGTGLGLPISKRFIELQAGNIWVESQFGVGSTFYFSLPLATTETDSITSAES